MFYSPEYLEEEQKSCRLHLSIFIFSVQPLLFLLKKKKKKTLSFLFQPFQVLLPWFADPADQLLRETEVAGEEE